ncbi:protein kinase domain-containing protein [Streptomyces cirratus]|uniref:protein kinase domain-containing protein n=1 Tax=Streptomyces cirratus TaxID=68187 RepID=UPI0036062A1A
MATDTRTGGSVLLKEARPLAGLDEDGADAVARLEREHWALEQLSGLDCIPAVVDYRKGHEHWFLAREYVEGKPLARELLSRNPMVADDGTPGAADARGAYTAWALKILDQVERGVEAMHAKGVVFGDLHPNNILVRPDDTLSFIDLETATPVGDESAQAIGAPGFRAPAGYRGTAVDRYALACIRLGRSDLRPHRRRSVVPRTGLEAQVTRAPCSSSRAEDRGGRDRPSEGAVTFEGSPRPAAVRRTRQAREA